MNKLTHFIDGSAVYGSTPGQTSQLRSFKDGKLKVFNDFGREMLPPAKDPEACLTMEQGSACFESGKGCYVPVMRLIHFYFLGDTRTNQMITLVVMHTLFLREHNRLATELERINPHWDDERIFLEARRVLIAELQVIVYNEFLPVLLGKW